MNLSQRLSRLLLAALFILPGVLHADVVYPALDIHNIPGSPQFDSGANLTGFTFDIDATVIAIANNTGPDIDIPDQDFNLASVGNYDGSIGMFSGSFTVGGGLLTGTFSDLVVFSLGGSDAEFYGDVIYTGGSMAGSFTTGYIDGIISGSDVIAKLGAVVPVPAAVWLFGSGLIGLVAVSRRKSA